ITMYRIAGSGNPGVRAKTGFAVFSPDGKQFALVVAKGNLEDNTNVYSLLLFRTVDISDSPVPRLLASFSSFSDREGIVDLKWSKDNNTLFFLGTNGDEATQLYSVHCDSGELKTLTNHRTSLVSYDLSEESKELVYAAERPEIDLNDEHAK